jgi:hypothetical protein
MWFTQGCPVRQSDAALHCPPGGDVVQMPAVQRFVVQSLPSLQLEPGGFGMQTPAEQLLVVQSAAATHDPPTPLCAQ